MITIYLRILGSYFEGLLELLYGVPSIALSIYFEKVQEEASLFLKELEEFAGGIEHIINSPFIPNYLAVLLKKIVFKYLSAKKTGVFAEFFGLLNNLEKMKYVLSLTDPRRHTEIRVFYYVISTSMIIDSKKMDGLEKLYHEMLEYMETICF